MRRDERVTVQGPVKEQQPDGMSHGGGGGMGTAGGGREGAGSMGRACFPGAARAVQAGSSRTATSRTGSTWAAWSGTCNRALGSWTPGPTCPWSMSCRPPLFAARRGVCTASADHCAHCLMSSAPTTKPPAYGTFGSGRFPANGRRLAINRRPSSANRRRGTESGNRRPPAGLQ